MTAAPKPENGTAVARVEAGPVVQWDRELEGAKMLLKSGLLPQSLKSPEAALFVILTGRDLGLSPVQSLRSIHVIQGKIEVAADMQLGLYHRAGGRSQWLELTGDKAVLKLAAPWLIEPHTESFTLADAKQAKLGGDNWTKYPKAMLRSRAITAGLKSIGFDPTAGMYAPGEIGGPEAEQVDGAAPLSPGLYLPKDEGPQAAVSPTPTDEPATAGTTSTSGGEDRSEVLDSEPKDERDGEAEEALTELELLLPNLTVDQQIYVREQLGDGADAVRLLAVAQLCKPPEKGATAGSA